MNSPGWSFSHAKKTTRYDEKYWPLVLIAHRNRTTIWHIGTRMPRSSMDSTCTPSITQMKLFNSTPWSRRFHLTSQITLGDLHKSTWDSLSSTLTSYAVPASNIKLPRRCHDMKRSTKLRAHLRTTCRCTRTTVFKIYLSPYIISRTKRILHKA